jgi:hypothetical protein
VSALVAAVVLCLSGCGRSGPALGEVAGKVTFESKPVREGRISFTSEQGGAGDAEFRDGAYALKAPLPVGDYKVMVSPLIVRQKVEGKGPVVGVEKPAPDIPEKYRTVGGTDLKATVKEGKNALDFNLKR